MNSTPQGLCTGPSLSRVCDARAEAEGVGGGASRSQAGQTGDAVPHKFQNGC